MMTPTFQPWTITLGWGPILATAIHAGHAVRPELARLMAVDDPTRLREEDPHTDRWLGVARNRIAVWTSRFEVDLNRPRDRAVYLSPADAWGIDVWCEPPPRQQYDASLALYDAFYARVENLVTSLISREGPIVVLDLHSYCHFRDGPRAKPMDPALAPQVNVGTGSLDRDRWGLLVDHFMDDLARKGPGNLDVRENVIFRGGHFVTWLNRRFEGEVCALAIEFKKTFMNEWTGEVYSQRMEAIDAALAGTVPGLLEQIGRGQQRARAL